MMNLLFPLVALAGMAVLIWTAWDAARRRRTWFPWVLPQLFVGILGVIPWLFVRARAPVLDRLSARRRLTLGASVVGLMLVQVMVVVFVTAFVVQTARIEGRAMEPTLQDQDRVLVNKLAYLERDPDRDDIVMFYFPLDPSRSFVKRVIGTEGDEIRIVDGAVYVNQLARKDTFLPDSFRSHDSWGPQVIPEGYYFVLGDHRNNSSDSRHWGFVPKKYIRGRVQWRFWPLRAAGPVERRRLRRTATLAACDSRTHLGPDRVGGNHGGTLFEGDARPTSVASRHE